MSDRLIHTEILRDDSGVAHLMGAYLTGDGAVYMRDLGCLVYLTNHGH